MNPAEQAITTGTELDQAKVWITRMGERGIYAPVTARLRTTAVERLASVLGDDEPRTVAYFLDRITELTERWMKKEAGNRETAVTYRSRSKVALEDYTAFQANPTEWKPRTRPLEANRKAKEPELKLVEAEGAEANPQSAPGPGVPTSAPTGPQVEPPTWDRCRLGEGVEFQYRLPDRGLEVKDVLRIALNLLSQAQDFDLTDPTQRNLFALARGEK